MKLYLVQHGEATTEKENPERPLTERGRSDVLKVAKFLKAEDVEIDHIWHSTKTRAIETAKIIADTLNIEELCEKREGLTPNDPVEPVIDQIKRLKPEDEIENLMIVGHLPFLQKLASYFLAASPQAALVEFRQGGVVCIEQQNQGPWQFAWAVHPDLLK